MYLLFGRDVGIHYCKCNNLLMSAYFPGHDILTIPDHASVFVVEISGHVIEDFCRLFGPPNQIPEIRVPVRIAEYGRAFC